MILRLRKGQVAKLTKAAAKANTSATAFALQVIQDAIDDAQEDVKESKGYARFLSFQNIGRRKGNR